MKLDHARLWVRQYSRNAGESTTKPDDIDRAIQSVCNRFCRMTRCLPTVTAVAIASGAATVSLTALAATRFTTQKLISAYLTTGIGQAMAVSTYEAVTRNLAQDPTAAEPRLLAWRDATTAKIYPTPNAAYTLEVRWWQPFTAWIPGAAGSIDLNLPDELLAEILPYGPPAVLQHNLPEYKYAVQSWQKYLEFEKSLMAAGTTGAQVADREKSDSRAFG